MRAEAKSLRFLGESPQKLTIPFFQRGYVWKEENWRELLESLTGENIKPFLGSVIIKKVDSDNPTEAQVIDGQQRLTTLTLLSKAIYDTLSLDGDQLSGNNPYDEDDEEDDKYGKSELKSFLFYKVNAADPFKKSKVKIQHSKVDRESYESIIKENFVTKEEGYCHNLDLIDEKSDTTSPILKCYKYFRLELRKMSIEDIIQLHNNLYNDGKKMLVLITMELDDDNEQSIFDTINRAGVQLSVSDIIKNDLFKKCMDSCHGNSVEEKEIIDLYEDKWEKLFYSYQDDEDHIWDAKRVFGNQQRTNLDFLLYCVAAVNWGKSEDIFSDLANVYKNATKDMEKNELVALVEQINAFAIVFDKYVLGLQNKYKSEEDPMMFSYDDFVKRLLLVLEVYGVQMFYPYVLKLLVEQESLGEDCLRKQFAILESYVVRRRLSGKSVSDYASKCDYLIKNGNDELISEMQRIDSGVSDEDVQLYLSSNIKTDSAKLILFVIELYRRRTDLYDVNALVYRYTLEHIMPRKWQTNWLSVPLLKKDGMPYVDEEGVAIDVTTEEGQKIRKKHIETIGNMTLLTHNLNASIKNNTFEKKIEGDGKKKPGYKEYSSLLITKDIIDRFEIGEKIWDERRIDSRTKELSEEFLEIWPNNIG